MRPTHIREGSLLYSVYFTHSTYMNVNFQKHSYRNTPNNIHANIWAPVAQLR